MSSESDSNSAPPPPPAPSHTPPSSSTDSSSPTVSATFSLRCLSSNVCVFPLATRNKTAPTQLFIGLATSMMIGLGVLTHYTNLPIWFQLLILPFLSLPCLPIIIPLQGLLLFLLTRGEWHDHKSGRLSLLFKRLQEFDAIAIQELFSGIFDTRYRDRVIKAAESAGLHYHVACHRVPTFPAFLLNTGTLLLSRYPILQSRTLVFKTRAFYDYFIVNRGCSWMRLELPFGEKVDFFTCHLAPPLKEVSERVKLLEYCSCPQEAQLKELIQFIRECTKDLPKSERRIVLAADLNIDCGSLRYFTLLHDLQEFGNIQDVFAKSCDTGIQCESEKSDSSSGTIPCSKNESTHDDDDADTDKSSSASLVRRKVPSANTNVHLDSPSIITAPPASPRSSPSSFGVAYNEWHADRGNGREPYSLESHAFYFESGIVKSRSLQWESTFGQRLPPLTTAAASSAASPLSTPHIHHASRHFETFLTHDTLLGSHTTHDFFFTNCHAVDQRVEPFLTQAAKKKLLTRNSTKGDREDDDDATTPPRTRRSEPPFTQLSDHCALVATLLMREPQ